MDRKRLGILIGIVVAALLYGGTIVGDRMRAGTPASAQSDSASVPVPVLDSVPLRKVLEPPSRTIAGFGLEQAPADSRFSVIFVPFGLGPNPDSLVIQVASSKPSVSQLSSPNLAGKNLLVSTRMLPPALQITSGGRYSGTLMFSRQGESLVPMLIDATAAP